MGARVRTAERELEFWFRPGSSRFDRAELGLFRLRLLSALRVAHGLSLPLKLVWESGPLGRFVLSSADRKTARWTRHVLAAAYPGGNWVEVSRVRPRGATYLARVAAAGPGLLAPFAGANDGPPWCDTAFSALGLLSPGVRVEWEAAPVHHRKPAGVVHPRETLERGPPGWRPGHLTQPERDLMDEAIQHSWSSQWGVQGRISATDASVPSSTVAYVAQAVVRAGRREGGSELRFRSAGPLPSLTRSWLLLSEHELLGLFPTPWARLALLPDASPSGNVPLWLGPEGRTTSTTLQVEPGVGRHLLTLGETGMGKSSLLVRLAVQATRHGGAVLFDPIGDTAERFLGALPESALDRTTLVSPTRSATGLNALGSAHGRVSGVDASGERRLGDLVHALRRVRAQHYGETPFWGPRIEETVTMALEAASGYPDGTLVTAFELLQGADRLGHGVPESARLLSAELRRRVAERPEDVEGARRLVAEVVRSAVLRRMICDAEARWSWEEALRPGQITVISGDAPHVGEQNSRYLLAVHLGLLWSSLVGRAVPSKLFVFLDEAQWYAHESAAEMLRMGRRFNLHLILATQALGSLPEGLRESALTNAGDLVIFRGSPADAREISRWVPDVPVDQILSLPRGQALVLCGKGREVLPTVIPLGTPPPDLPGRLSRVARQTLERFGTPGSPDTMVEGSPDPNPRPDLAPPRAGSTDPLQRRVRTTLAAGAWAAGPGGSIRVHLAKLREVADPDGAVVREMGNVLRTIGALIRVGRDSGGAFWVLDADKLCSDPSYTPTPEEKSAAETRWRNLTADGPARL